MFKTNVFKQIHCPEYNVGLCSRGKTCWFSHSYVPATDTTARKKESGRSAQPPPRHISARPSVPISSQVSSRTVANQASSRTPPKQSSSRTPPHQSSSRAPNQPPSRTPPIQPISAKKQSTTALAPSRIVRNVKTAEFIPLKGAAIGLSRKPLATPKKPKMVKSLPKLIPIKSTPRSKSHTHYIVKRDLIPKADYPTIPYQVRQKFPSKMRQTMLEKFLDELLLIKKGEWRSAVAESMQVEDEIYRKAKSVVAYKNSCAHAYRDISARRKKMQEKAAKKQKTKKKKTINIDDQEEENEDESAEEKPDIKAGKDQELDVTNDEDETEVLPPARKKQKM
eukprot:TRINITY_DN10221_c0_g1_i1.p1 TRINITY_DN10221_c0_g1~~TRINITY_DN10221_c0_g1_i1.p1  ORF type:complete len:337 (-),score=47.76 TRINITY_DN10221_c0_g1_i1:468-1478(-)